MSSLEAEEIELLDRVLLRLGVVDTDDKLESCVGRFLAPVILKALSPHDNVRKKVIEVLTHIKRRVTSRSNVKIPVEALLDQFASSADNMVLQSFAIIFITIGFPRLGLEEQSKLIPKLVCCESKNEDYQDKFFMLILPVLGDMILPVDLKERKNLLQLEDKPSIKKNFLNILLDILLLPYGCTTSSGVPPGLSAYSFNRIASNDWKACDLQKVKSGVVRFLCAGVFDDKDIFIHLITASADTRFDVASPAVVELSKMSTVLDFSDPYVTAPLYSLFFGNNTPSNVERHIQPVCPRIRQKLLQYLLKCRGKGINAPKALQVVFEGLFGNTNQKCKILALQFSEILIKEGNQDVVTKVAKVFLSGITKTIAADPPETNEVLNAAYSALSQLARCQPHTVNQDLKLVLTYFTNLANAPSALQSSIREALVAMAPAFSWNKDGKEVSPEEFHLDGQQHLLLAMLSDNTQSKALVVQNATSVFLTTCFPEYYAPARYLLLLIAGERNSLRENVTSFLYGTSKKDHVNYGMISSIEHPEDSVSDFNKLSSEQRRIILPSFKAMMQHIDEIANKRLTKNQTITVGKTKIPFTLEVYEELLDYLRLCLWFSAGAKTGPGDDKSMGLVKKFIQNQYNDEESNEIVQYIKFVQRSVEARRTDSNLLCLYDLLNASPEIVYKNSLHLLEPLSYSLKDVSETMRINVAQNYGVLLAYGFQEEKFDNEVNEILSSLNAKSLENKHGWLLVLGHAFNSKLEYFKKENIKKDYCNWTPFVETVKVIATLLCQPQWLLLSAGLKCLSMIGKAVKIPNVSVDIEIKRSNDDEQEDDLTETEICSTTTKLVMFHVVFAHLTGKAMRLRIREEAAKCLGSLAIGDGEYFTDINLNKFLAIVKVEKDVALNIAISEAIVSTLNGYEVSSEKPAKDFVNPYCNDERFEAFLESLIRLVTEPNLQIRQACSVWLLAVVKHCSHRLAVINKKQILQFAFTELLSDDSEFVQDVASRGLGLVYSLSDSESQDDLANSLLDQLMGTKRKVKKVADDTELFAEGMLGKTPTGGNITTYKELCALASDLNKPDMIYQFMQLANHNAAWTTKLGAAFGLKSLANDSKAKMQPYLGKIIPRLYRYKYDPTPKIQNSMISIWDSIVDDPKETIEKYYWEILRELLDNVTFNEWRVRIACCLAIRDLLKRPNGLRLRSDDKFKMALQGNEEDAVVPMEVDEVPEPELKELWGQLFRVMDDFHEGTRLAAQGTVTHLSKLCVIAASSDHGKSGLAVASSVLPLLLEIGVTHKVPEIRKVSIKTISDMIDSSGALITPHLPTLIPCLLNATGETESSKLSYLSTRLGADNDAQEAVDTIRAEAAKSHHTMETITKCVGFIDYNALEKMTPAILESLKTSVNLGTKIACAHFVCLISVRLGKEMTPLVGKYLGACFLGLKGRNATVRKYNASAIGHLLGIAKEQSIKNLFSKLDELYMENPSNRAVVQTIQAINKRQHEVLKDYTECVLPIVFFAMHEEPNEENKATIELWKDLWIDICPGDAGIRMNLKVIIPKLEAALEAPSWPRKAQAGNGVYTIAKRISADLQESDRLKLINLLLSVLSGRTFLGKERLVQALAALCKGLDNKHAICLKIIEAVMRECRKEEPQYRTLVLPSLGDILETLEIDRFEEVYQMIWYLMDKKDLKVSHDSDDENDDEEVLRNSKDLTADEKNKRAQILNKLKEVICETLGKAWPKNALKTQKKYQELFAEQCARCLKDSTRQVQVSLMAALTKFVERLMVFDNLQMDGVSTTSGYENETTKQEKEMKIDIEQNREDIVKKICNNVLSAVYYAAGLPHTGLKKESLNIVLVLIKRLSEAKDLDNLMSLKKSFDEYLEKYQKDSAPEVRCRLKDIEEKFAKQGL